MKIFLFFANNYLGGDFITFHYRYRKQIIISIIIIIITILFGVLIYLNKKEKPQKEESVVVSKKEPLKKEQLEEQYIVDIKGQINKPGIYELNTSSRVIDVIKKAGGLTELADTSVLNLSKKIIDEMVIIVYSKDEVSNFKKTKEIEEQVQKNCSQPNETSLKNDACITSIDSSSAIKLSLNKATKEELMLLPGIGESKANDIIKYRDENNGFKSIDELKNVPGIGDSIFDQIKENVTI